jgi:hypothetical protein
LGVVPIVGWPSVFGLTLGVFLSNTVSYLGPIDLISPIFSFAGLAAIQILKKKSSLAGFGTYTLLLSVWVTFELNYVLSAPLLPTFIAVLVGIAAVVLGLAYPLFRALKASSLVRRFETLDG